MKVKVSETELWPLYILTPATPNDAENRLIDLPDALVDKFRATKLELLRLENEIQRHLSAANYKM